MANSKIEDLETLLEINKAIFSTMETKEILFLIVKKISEIMQVTRCSIILIDRKMNIGHVLSTYEDPDLGTLSIDLKKYPEITRAMEDEKTVLIQDVGVDPIVKEVRDNLISIGIRSIMVIPIHYSEKAIGALYLRTSRKEKKFSEKELKISQVIASMAAVALNNARLFNIIKEEKDLLEKMAVTDDMTRLYNHRFFVRRLKEEYKRSERYKTNLACIMIDIDNFKNVNDTYGHQAGDIVLQEIARIIKRCVRETDVVARYGGEEFAVILPHTGNEAAVNLANRIRNAVKKSRSDSLEPDVSITVSIGVSTYPHPEVNNMDDLIRKADDGLYQAKSHGKDVVVSL
jgi:diguanylate cyclase (GGDEF)-like protein